MPTAVLGRRTPKKLSSAQREVRKWIRANWGRITEVAETLELSHQYVQRIAYGRNECHSAGFRVEKELESRGCPVVRV